MPLVKPPDITVPPPSGKPGGLGQRLEDALVRFASRVLNAAKDTLAGVLRFGLDTFLEGIEPFLMRAYGPMLAKVRDTPGCPPELKSLITLGLSGESQAGSAVMGMLGSTVTSGMVGSFIGAALSPVTFYVNSIFRPQRPDLPTLQAGSTPGWRPTSNGSGRRCQCRSSNRLTSQYPHHPANPGDLANVWKTRWFASRLGC